MFYLGLSLIGAGITLALIAIYMTLCRIANSFEQLCSRLDSLQDNTTLHSIQDFAWHAGRSFEQGRRTDR